MTAKPLELTRVVIVLRHYPAVAGLDHLAPIITSFIRPSPHLSLRDASLCGSTALLDWIWNASCTSVEERLPGWSLTNYLRTELHYYRWVFYESLTSAARRGDLEMVAWLFRHFSGCGTPAEVVEEAAEHGHLSVLQFLIEHDAGRHYSSDERPTMEEFEGQNDTIPVSALGGAGNLVSWGRSAILEAIKNKQVVAARWLLEFGPSPSDQLRDLCIKVSLSIGETELAGLLLPPDKKLTDYDMVCSRPDAIEWALNNGFIRNPHDAANAILPLASSARLDLMQQIVQLHSSQIKLDLFWFSCWREALRKAVEAGNLPTIRWLLENPTWRKFRSKFKLEKDRVFTMCAGMEDRPDIVQYLYEQGIDNKYGEMLLNSVQKGHMNTVVWLIEHFPKREHVADYCVLNISAEYGRLEILRFLQQREPTTVPGFFPPPSRWWNSRRNTRKPLTAAGGMRSQWRPTDTMDDAAANGHLVVMKWLHTHRSEGCTTAAMDGAAANGHLDILHWLHEHRSEGCTAKALERAAINGHLEVVQWLVLNTAAECTAEAMDGAVRQGDLDMVKLLFKTRSDCCSAEAIDTAIRFGHLRVASWLRKLFPGYTPEPFYGTYAFEKLLYIHALYAIICPPERGSWATQPFKFAQKKAVRAWLTAVPADLSAPI